MAGEERPVRVQLSRRKGWRMPPNTVRVSRPGPWGNPFNLKSPEHCWTALSFGERGDPKGRHAASVKMFRLWLEAGRAVAVDGCGLYGEKDGKTFAAAESPSITAPAPPTIDAIRNDLKGKNLACWCAIISHGSYCSCHADVLLSLANDMPLQEVIRENTRRAKGQAL